MLRRISSHAPYASIRPLLPQHLLHPSPAIRAAAVEQIGLHKDDSFLLAILDNVKTSDPQLGRATAFALSQFPTEPSRNGLLHLLQHGDRSVVIAAIEGLRAIGTVHEIEHLAVLARGWFADRIVKKTARDAIAAIQRRSGAMQGSLSLAHGGELSLDRCGGALSKAA